MSIKMHKYDKGLKLVHSLIVQIVPLVQKGRICIISPFETTAFFEFQSLGSVLHVYFMCDVLNIREIFHIKHISDEIVLYLLSYVPFCR